MDFLTQYDIPFLHPVVVHFPVAMLSTAVLFAVIWLFTSDSKWFFVYASMHIVGTLGAIVAFRTGEAVAEDTEGVPIVEELVDTHELYGKITMILAIVVSIYILFSLYSTSRRHDWTSGTLVRISFVLLAAAIAIMTLMTGHIGGIMVWGIPA